MPISVKHFGQPLSRTKLSTKQIVWQRNKRTTEETNDFPSKLISIEELNNLQFRFRLMNFWSPNQCWNQGEEINPKTLPKHLTCQEKRKEKHHNSLRKWSDKQSQCTLTAFLTTQTLSQLSKQVKSEASNEKSQSVACPLACVSHRECVFWAIIADFWIEGWQEESMY